MEKIEGTVLEVIKSVLPELDWDKFDGDITVDAINARKSERLVTTDVHQREIASATGRIYGEGQTLFGRILGEEAKGKQYKELLPLVESRFTALSEKITSLEKDGGKGLSEKEKNELAELRNLANEQKTKIQDLTSGLEEAKSEAENKVAKILLDNEVTSIFDSIGWIDDVSPYAKKGLRDELFSKYEFRKDGDKLLVFGKDGTIVRDKTGQYETKSFFEDKAKEAKLFKLNGGKIGAPDHGGKPKPDMTPEQQAHFDRMMAHAKSYSK